MPENPVRWGILATGKIARQFATDLALVDDAELVAVASRDLTTAQQFAATHGTAATTAYGSYEALVAADDVDVVYVATPHSRHLVDARLALEAGKPVLCEKAFTLDAPDAQTLVDLAVERGLFLMEAMWSACHPAIHAVARRLEAGEFGIPRHFHAELGFVVPPDPASRFRDPSLGAGALLDVGIYPLTVAHLLLGEALTLTAHADVITTETGSYDDTVVIAGTYPNGVLATMVGSIASWTSREATIGTTTGRLVLDDFHHPTRITFTPYADGRPGTPVEIEPEEPVIGRGYGNEIAEVGRCLRAGLTESPWVPHAQTLAIMWQMDQVRAAVGVVYPRSSPSHDDN